MGILKLGGLALVATAAEQCGPTHRQVGEAVLVAWPLVFLVGVGLQTAILYFWRRRWGARLRTPLSAMVACFAVAVSLALGVLVHSQPGYGEWVTFALWLFGSSYLAILLMATRVWLLFDRNMPQLGAHLVAIGFQVLPAAALAGGMWDGERLDPEQLFILPGYMGIPAGILFVGLMVEAVLRNKKKPTAAPN